MDQSYFGINSTSALNKMISHIKPNTSIAMQNLIDEVREVMPFDADETQLCADSCNGCSLKLLEFLDMELQDWQQKLQDGVVPSFGDIHKMGKTCKKIYMVLKKNGLVDQ